MPQRNMWRRFQVRNAPDHDPAIVLGPHGQRFCRSLRNGGQHLLVGHLLPVIKQGLATLQTAFEVESREELNRVIDKLRMVKNVVPFPW